MEETVVFIRFTITIIVTDCCYCYCNVIVWLVGENGGNCSFCQICWTLFDVYQSLLLTVVSVIVPQAPD